MNLDKYEEMAGRAERGELAVMPGTTRRGDAASSAAQRDLKDATGATSLQQALSLPVGRPPVGAQHGPSPVVRARVPQALKDRLHALALQEQRDESDIVREALAAYFELRRVSSRVEV